MRQIKLLREKDINGKSGVGDVWEGVEFDNGNVAGRWNCTISSLGTYSSVEALEKIHGHNGATKVVESNLGFLINLVAKEGIKTSDGNKLIAQGYIASNGMVVLTFLANINSIYFYTSIEELMMIYGEKVKIEDYKDNDNVLELFKRDKLFAS